MGGAGADGLRGNPGGIWHAQDPRRPHSWLFCQIPVLPTQVVQLEVLAPSHAMDLDAVCLTSALAELSSGSASESGYSGFIMVHIIVDIKFLRTLEHQEPEKFVKDS